MERIMKEIGDRIKKLRTFMEKEKIATLFLANPKNVFYLTGKETGRVLITKNAAILWVRDLYKEIHANFYEKGAYPFKVNTLEKDAVRRCVKKRKFKSLWVEDLRVAQFKNLKNEFKVKIISTDVMRRVRATKFPYEIIQLKKAAKVAKEGMKKAYEIIHEGIKETDALAEIEAQIRRLGSEEPPFGNGALLSSGKNSANIHALSTKRKIREKSLVVVDLGAKVKGYYSDMTRTIKVGKLNREQRKIFEFVRDLELRTIDQIEEGIETANLHQFVEKEINKLGYKFYHNTGHGIGLEVHESPNLGPQSEDIIQDGMVFTIEPGIYLPGKFGIRFEDMILCKGEKVEILTEI